MKDSNSRITRWYLALQPFRFEVVHRPGAQMAVADFLSRPGGGERSVGQTADRPGSGRGAYLMVAPPFRFVSLKSDSRALMTVAGVSGGSSLTDKRWHKPVTSVDVATHGELPTMLQPRSIFTIGDTHGDSDLHFLGKAASIVDS
ncbi:hypothetical protein AOLI_G00036390 [Acnodon oligacanthus]